MAVDSYARILAMAAIDAAESGGGSGRGIDNVYILNEHLHIVYSTGEDIDIGQVVGAPGLPGKVYIPHMSEDKILSWTVEDKEGEIPEPVDLFPWDEWQPVEEADREKTDFIWDEI